MQITPAEAAQLGPLTWLKKPVVDGPPAQRDPKALVLILAADHVIGDPEAFMETDLELHDAIRVAADNAILGRFMESIRALGLASRRRTGTRRKVQEQTLEDHRKIVAALRARDPEAASAAMHRHLENVERA